MNYQPETIDDIAEGSPEDFDLYLEDIDFDDDPWGYDDDEQCWCGGDCMLGDDDPLDDDELVFIIFEGPDADEQ